jgi:hypothetical protein
VRLKKMLTYVMLSLLTLILPGLAHGAETVMYDVEKTEYAGTAIKDVPATVQLKTPSGSSKYVIPSDRKGNFHQAYIHIGRSLNAENYLTVTFGDGATKVYNDNTWAAQGNVTIPDSDFAVHPSRGITVKFTHNGDYAENLYLLGYWLTGSETGATPAPSATPSPSVKPSATPVTTPKPTASATANPTSPVASPSPDPGGSDGGDTGENCLCPELCEIMPGVLAGFGDQLDGIKNALSPLHNDLAIVQNQLFGVRDDLYIMNGELEQINSNTAPLHADLIDIKALTSELIRQLTPTQDYNVPSPIVLPNYYKPPDVASQSFVDNTQYFSDPGDASTPGAMPAAPEPKNWTFEGKEINQDAEMVPAPKQTQDPVMTTSPDMQQDPVMTTSPDMQQDPVMTSQPDMKQDEILVKQSDLIMDKPLEMETNEYPVRWDSSQFP